MPSLAERAILVHFTSPMWEPKVQDPSLASRLENASGASAKTVRVYKTILKAESLKALRSIRADTYTNVHRKLTLPWVHQGPAILPVDLFPKYRQQMDAARDREATLREMFFSEYPMLVERSRDDLGSLYDATLYPSMAELRARFEFRFTAQPLPSSADFRIQDPSLIEGYETVLETAKLGAMKEAYERLHGAIEHMAERLAIYQPATDDEPTKHPFRASLVENLKEVVELMPALNISDDPKLAALAERARENLTYHDADSLRESDSIRHNVLDEARALLADLKGTWQ